MTGNVQSIADEAKYGTALRVAIASGVHRKHAILRRLGPSRPGSRVGVVVLSWNCKALAANENPVHSCAVQCEHYGKVLCRILTGSVRLHLSVSGVITSRKEFPRYSYPYGRFEATIITTMSPSATVNGSQ